MVSMFLEGGLYKALIICIIYLCKASGPFDHRGDAAAPPTQPFLPAHGAPERPGALIVGPGRLGEGRLVEQA